MPALQNLLSNLKQRPWWMNAVLLFCAYMTFIYMPFDLFVKPVSEDDEVWFGFIVHGWAAKATEPLHWFIYGAGMVGLWKMKPWIHPWACLYTLQVAIAMSVWSLRSDSENALIAALISPLPFLALAFAFWRAKDKFQHNNTNT